MSVESDPGTTRAPGRVGPSGFVLLTTGLLAGVLVTVLVAPDRPATVVGTGRGAGVSAATADGGGAAGAEHVAGPEATGTSPGDAAGGAAGAATRRRVAGGQSSAAPTARGTAAGTPAGRVPEPVGAVRGVTAGKIRIGVALLDLGPIRSLGPAFDNGDRRAHLESILAAWRRAGVLPLFGRDVEFVYRSFAVFTSDDQRAACVHFAQDDKVFAVLADSTFQLGMECLTREFKIPVISADGDDEDAYLRGKSLFSLRFSTDRLFRNFIHWAEARGLLKGKKIGLYSLNEPAEQALVTRTLRRELTRLGYKLAADVVTDNNLASPNDAVAVQRFRAAGVNLAILEAGRPGFMQQAQGQGYRPTYIDSDWNSGTTDVALTLGPPSQWNGMFGMTGQRLGDWNSGIPPTPPAAKCTSDFQRASGKAVDPKSRQAEWLSLVSSCDMANVALAALRGAGRSLTADRLVAALEGLRNLPMGLHPDQWSFAPGKHDGVNVQRTLRADAGCSCFKVVSGFSPLFVP